MYMEDTTSALTQIVAVQGTSTFTSCSTTGNGGVFYLNAALMQFTISGTSTSFSSISATGASSKGGVMYIN